MLSRRQMLGALALAGGGSTLSACGFRPLYGGGLDGSVAQDLSAITINDPATRLEQAVRNELVFLFTGGGAPSPARYRLQLSVSSTTSALVIESVTGRPTATALNLTALVVLTDIETGAVLLNQTFLASASFEESTQRFADQRAALDAGQRAARDVAERIRTRVAVTLR